MRQLIQLRAISPEVYELALLVEEALATFSKSAKRLTAATHADYEVIQAVIAPRSSRIPIHAFVVKQLVEILQNKTPLTVRQGERTAFQRGKTQSLSRSPMPGGLFQPDSPVYMAFKAHVGAAFIILFFLIRRQQTLDKCAVFKCRVNRTYVFKNAHAFHADNEQTTTLGKRHGKRHRRNEAT